VNICLAASAANAVGGFQNLDFESANIPPGTPVATFVPVSEAFPDWSAYFTTGGVNYPQTEVAYDGISTGGNVISLVDDNVGYGFGPIQGNYSAFLFGGLGSDGNVYSASISQAGVIPVGTQTLTMEAWEYDCSPIVAINGQPINMIPLETISFYTVYGGSIPSSDVGPPVTLSFTDPSASPGMFELDDIAFSQTVLSPEPNIAALTAIGGLLFGARKWFARRG
jgi:hypothetical protein